jgi:pimeloyl-ACP methyl ester carboxylesterase
MTRVHFVLIRGLLREARHWGKFTSYLQQQFPGALISTPNVPGNGMQHHEISPKSISGMTEALRRQINLNQPIRLIALSMGGMIAIDWMARYPHEVAGVVLINTSARPLSPFYRRLRWIIYPRIICMLFHSAMQKEADILSLTSNRHQHDNRLLESWRRWQRQYPVSRASARNQFLAAAKFSIPAKPRQPMLIVTSQADQLVDYRCSLKLAQIWQAGYVQHESAGHDLPLDEPEWLASTIRAWFDPDSASIADSMKLSGVS